MIDYKELADEGGNMDDKEKERMDKDISKAVCRALDKLLKSLRDTPDLILEGSEEGSVAEDTIDDIRDWLFSRRSGNGHTDSITDKQ